MRWPWSSSETETRAAADYGDAVIETLLRNAGQTIPATAQATGALELCAGAVGRAFAAAEVVSDSPLAGLFDAQAMSLIGRSLIRDGEIVYSLDVGARSLIPAATFDVWGNANPASWIYRVDVNGPSLFGSRWIERAGLFHFTYAVDQREPWRGLSPLDVASIAGKLSAETDKALADESSGPRGHILPTPIDGDDPKLGPFRQTLKRLGGSILTVETTQGQWVDVGGGRIVGTPKDDWQTKRVGADPPAAMVNLQSEAAQLVLGACGVPVELLTGGDGTGQREAWRRFLFGTVGPLGRLVAAELQRVLEVPVSLEWDELRASDLSGRARAVGSLVKAGYTPESAAAVAGIPLEVASRPARDSETDSPGVRSLPDPEKRAEGDSEGSAEGRSDRNSANWPDPAESEG